MGSESSWRFQLRLLRSDIMYHDMIASTKIVIKLKKDEKVVENSFIVAEDHGNFCTSGDNRWRSENTLSDPAYQQSDHTLSVYLSFQPQYADIIIRFSIRLNNVKS